MEKKKETILTCLERIPDTREVRGIRYPLSSLLKLLVLGLLSGQTTFAHIQVFAESHWKVLWEPLGFKRKKHVPHAMTLSRQLSQVTVKQLQNAFAHWMRNLLEEKEELIVSVDGKWSNQATDKKGNPLILLNIFEQEMKLTLQEYAMNKKVHEPTKFKEEFKALCEKYPALYLFTFDALYAQRDLASLIVGSGRHYLVRLKDNQIETKELVERLFPKRKDFLESTQMLDKKGDVLLQEPTIET